jgi:hypothetical protein
MPSKLAVNTRLIIIFGLMSAPALSACSTTSSQSRYSNGPCNPSACAPVPIQNLCCYAPPPVIYTPPPAPIMAAPTVVIEPEPEPAVYIEPYVEPQVYSPPPTVIMRYPEPAAPIPQPLPARK